MNPTTAIPAQRQFPCKQCGASLVFAPGTTSLKCGYCGTENEIAPAPFEDAATTIEELDFAAYAATHADAQPTRETVTVKCTSCGAETDFTHDVAADHCPFCGAAIVAMASSRKLIQPRSLLPFHITHQQAGQAFKQWVGGLWLAPNDLVRVAERAKIDGAYMPAWTYDSNTTSRYAGARGDDYYTSETYTATENGRSVTRTRQVRRTRWTSVSGRVSNTFDDVLVLASQSLPEKQSAALEPWDLKALIPYRDEFLSGFSAETYQIDLPQGFERAKAIMEEWIRAAIRRDIGGDHQRIDTVNTSYFNVTFKHILLPMWISAYRYHQRIFRFLVNARTGEVQGERPWSTMKITLLVVFVLALVVGAVVMFQR